MNFETDPAVIKAIAPVVVGYLGTAESNDAVALAYDLAETFGTSVVAASVFGLNGVGVGPEWSYWRDNVRTAAERRLDRLDEIEVARGTQLECLILGATSAAAGLMETANTTQAAAIVVGSCHWGFTDRVLIGSVGVELLRRATCPVFVAPRGYSRSHDSAAALAGKDSP